MTLEEHIEAEKRVASGFLVACQTTREADEFGVYGKEAQMYEDKYYAHTERADLLEELKTLRKALMLACEYFEMEDAGLFYERFMQEARASNDN